VLDDLLLSENMRKAILPTLYHESSSDKKPQHQYVPVGENFWCDYRKTEAQKNLKNF